jgi:hypothetical protein
MKIFGKEVSMFKILIIFFAMIFLISIGLCGMDRNSQQEFGGTLSGMGFLGFLISIPGGILTGIVWVIYSVIQLSSSKNVARLNLSDNQDAEDPNHQKM